MTSDKKIADTNHSHENKQVKSSSIIFSPEKHGKGTPHPVINPNQLTSLSAMIAYAASKSGKSEFRIERALADSFKVANAKFLAAQDFDAAIRYLADIIHS